MPTLQEVFEATTNYYPTTSDIIAWNIVDPYDALGSLVTSVGIFSNDLTGFNAAC